MGMESVVCKTAKHVFENVCKLLRVVINIYLRHE